MEKRGISKKALLTNCYMNGYSGSELDTLAIANYFLKSKYQVDIFTLKVGFPLLADINPKIRIITIDDIQQLHSEYDILWAHHYPLVDYLLFTSNVKFRYIHYVCLSSFEPLEQIPLYYERLNLVSVMSYNTRKKLVQESSVYKKEKIDVFSNYAPEKYFKSQVAEYKELKKVAIVSNHVPFELLEVKKMLEEDKIKVDIYGVNYNYVKVDDEILSHYDLIISIGKTCFYSIAIGIPTYVYDRNGGCGYVRKNNVQVLFEGNFVCLALSVQKNPQELYRDIIDNYYYSKEEINYLKDFGMTNFCFEKNMDLCLKKLFRTKPYSNDISNDESVFLRKTSPLYVEKISEYEKNIQQLEYYLLDKKCKCQLFISVNGSFIEEESQKKISQRTDDKYEVSFLIDKNCDKIRFDFCEEEFVVLSDFTLNESKTDFDCHGLILLDDKLVSVDNDPYIVIHKHFKKNELVHFQYRLTKYSLSEVSKIFDENYHLKQELFSIKSGRFFKIYSKFKKIIQR